MATLVFSALAGAAAFKFLYFYGCCDSVRELQLSLQIIQRIRNRCQTDIDDNARRALVAVQLVDELLDY